MGRVLSKELVQTTSTDFLAVLNHAEAGVSRQCPSPHSLQPGLGFGMDYSVSHSKERMAENPLWSSSRNYPRGTRKHFGGNFARRLPLVFQTSLETRGAQTAVASLTTENIDWKKHHLFYERQKLASRDQGRACIAIGPCLEALLKQLPSKGFLFPKLVKLKESWRAAGIVVGICALLPLWMGEVHSNLTGMLEWEAIAHLGRSSRAVLRAYTRNTNSVMLPLEYYEATRDKKLIDFQAAAGKMSSIGIPL